MQQTVSVPMEGSIGPIGRVGTDDDDALKSVEHRMLCTEEKKRRYGRTRKKCGPEGDVTHMHLSPHGLENYLQCNIKLMTLLIRRNWAINYSVRKRAAKTERNEVPKVQPTYWFANSLASFARIKLLGANNLCNLGTRNSDNVILGFVISLSSSHPLTITLTFYRPFSSRYIEPKKQYGLQLFSALFLCHVVWVDLSQIVPPRCIMYCFIRVDPPEHQHQ